jgi:hypothetical protein
MTEDEAQSAVASIRSWRRGEVEDLRACSRSSRGGGSRIRQ